MANSALQISSIDDAFTDILAAPRRSKPRRAQTWCGAGSSPRAKGAIAPASRRPQPCLKQEILERVPTIAESKGPDPRQGAERRTSSSAFVVRQEGLRHGSPVGLFRRMEVQRSALENFVPQCARQAFGGRVRGEQAILVDMVKRSRRVRRRPACGPLLTGTQVFLSFPALGNVGHDGQAYGSAMASWVAAITIQVQKRRRRIFVEPKVENWRASNPDLPLSWTCR